MLLRISTAFACALILTACQQSVPTLSSTAGVTAPSSLSMKAVDVPFSGAVTGEAAFDFVDNSKGCASGFTTKTTATGTATHLGLATWQSQHCVGAESEIEQGDLALIAANGDKVSIAYTGSCALEGANVVCSGQFNVTGGTGRFSDATGTVQWGATIVFEGFEDYSWPGRWHWEGTIRY